MVLEAFGQALLMFLNIELLLAMIVGVVVGLIFGIIPGIGGLLAIGSATKSFNHVVKYGH